ncbi:MAG: hypothetical protein KJ667_02360 [Alphaproteobacteria bacterium]|nr:hypothetical protein [Alphaproteobacteria bacterium]
MTDLNAAAIQRLQSEWAEIAVDIVEMNDQYAAGLRRITKGLTEMGLDLTQDATYELLSPGLTRMDFARTQTRITMLQLLDSYYSAQKMTARDAVMGDFAARHFHGLDRVLKVTLPAFEDSVAVTGMPKDIDHMQAREIALIREMKADGTLEMARKQAAQKLAIESFRTAIGYHNTLQSAAEKDNSRVYSRGFLQEAQQYVERGLKAIDQAQEFYQPAIVKIEYGMFGGWTDKTAVFNRRALSDIGRDLTLRLCGVEFAQARKFQDQGHFVLDASGSGHGAMVMPMQDILYRLKRGLFDIDKPETFTAMGTDIDTFWNYYQRERDAVLRDDNNKNLLKPGLTR